MDVEASVEKYRDVVEIAFRATEIIGGPDPVNAIRVEAFKAILDKVLIKLSEEELKDCPDDGEEVLEALTSEYAEDKTLDQKLDALADSLAEKVMGSNVGSKLSKVLQDFTNN